jgi:hypothetical protein
MVTRTTIKSVTFKRPFVLGEFDEVQPAGVYRVETDEELLEGISFPVYRRTLTMIHLHASPGHPGRTQMLDVNPTDLEAALERDKESSVPVERRSPGLEPKLEDLMADPIFQLIMCSDGLSQAEVWDAIKTARAHAAAGYGAEGPTKSHELPIE